MEKFYKLPELLAPAGSERAFHAAIEGGADAIYFGGSAFNARMGAENFDSQALCRSVDTAHKYGVKCYMTLNTLVTDREIIDCVKVASDALESGVDALIVADLGVASAIKRCIPEAELHASTQASGHSSDAAKALERLGFSRMVMAREASFRDIKEFTSATDMELEVFVHGALCVCHSGQCLFSSLVGGRSGNRGECAQPCRLPFAAKRGEKIEKYPLSLKDLCLAAYVPELIDARVSSLKIEGRMKPPEYVLAVTKVWRKLLDERRAATPDEIRYLAEIFSRGGFTDGYFKEKINASMLGIRSERDKLKTKELPRFDGLKREIPRTPIAIEATVRRGEPVSLTLTCKEKSATVTSDAPNEAINAPMSKADYERSLLKLGATGFIAESVKINADDGLIVPVSKLNALRRAAVEALEIKLGDSSVAREYKIAPYVKNTREKLKINTKTARFLSPDTVTDKAKEFFDIIYLPLERYDGSVGGVIVPPVIFAKEKARVKAMLAEAKEKGATHALVGNIGHVGLAAEFGFEIHGDLRLNVTNSETAEAYGAFGFKDIIVSPELTLAQIRDIGSAAVVYGRIPLMLLEKCVIRELSGCQGYSGSQLCHGEIFDRRGVAFPVYREGAHRNVIYNSIKTSMSDKQSDLARAGISAQHFIFTDETAEDVDRVIRAFEHAEPLPFDVRRIK